MAVEDYKKVRTSFKSHHESSLKTFNTIVKWFNSTQSVAESLAKIGTSTDKLLKLKASANKIYLEWTAKAKDVEALQTDVQAAEKAKDSSKVTELKRQIEQKHAEAEKLRTKYQANIDKAITARDDGAARAKSLIEKLPFD